MNRRLSRPNDGAPLAIVLLAAAATLLAGCSGEPSAADIEGAYRAHLDTATRATAAMMGPKMAAQLKELTPQLHALKKISCAPHDDAKVYTCQVEVDMTAPMLGRHKQVVPMVLVETADGWRLPG